MVTLAVVMPVKEDGSTLYAVHEITGPYTDVWGPFRWLWVARLLAWLLDGEH